jgi:hypothetical protein
MTVAHRKIYDWKREKRRQASAQATCQRDSDHDTLVSDCQYSNCNSPIPSDKDRHKDWIIAQPALANVFVSHTHELAALSRTETSPDEI